MRICVEYVIGVYTLTKQDGGFLFPDLPHKNTQSMFYTLKIQYKLKQHGVKVIGLRMVTYLCYLLIPVLRTKINVRLKIYFTLIQRCFYLHKGCSLLI